MELSPKQRALSFCYVLSQLLEDNLEVVVIEKNESKEEDLGQLRDKLIKLRSANRNAFKILERNIGGDGLKELKNDIELTLETLWT